MKTALKHRNLIELFERSLATVTDPGKICLEIVRADRHETLTFGQLNRRSAAFATWLLRESGLARGNKVAILGKNCSDWDIALWGVIRAGAVPVLVDPERGPEGIIAHLEATDARGIVMAADYETEEARRDLTLFAESRDIRLVVMSDEPLCEPMEPDTEALAQIGRDIDPDDTAAILCTSGTTGDPREVELTHTNFVANIEGSVAKVELTSEDVLGHILPPHHSFGLTVGKFLPLAVGATNIYTNKYREVSDLMRDRGITIFIAIPALFTTLAKKLEDGLKKQKREKRLLRLLDRVCPKLVGRKIREKQGWTRLRFFLSGAAPMPPWVLESLWKRGFRMYEGYGTTENSPVYGFNNRPDKLGSVGRPIDTLAVKIVDESNLELPPQERGEICLGGPCIMKGYYKNPKATSAAISTDENGIRWLHTGDLGSLDKDGNLHITGRKKYLIILPGGKNVNPERVETALSEAHFVKEVLVVPTRRIDPNGIMEETMRALVQPAWDNLTGHTGRTEDDLATQPHLVKSLVWESIRTCQQNNRQLSAFEKIASHHLEIHPGEFVKTSTGKVKREHYINLEHLEAKHTPVVECTAAQSRKAGRRDTAGTQPPGN